MVAERPQHSGSSWNCQWNGTAFFSDDHENCQAKPISSWWEAHRASFFHTSTRLFSLLVGRMHLSVVPSPPASLPPFLIQVPGPHWSEVFSCWLFSTTFHRHHPQGISYIYHWVLVDTFWMTWMNIAMRSARHSVGFVPEAVALLSLWLSIFTCLESGGGKNKEGLLPSSLHLGCQLFIGIVWESQLLWFFRKFGSWDDWRSSSYRKLTLDVTSATRRKEALFPGGAWPR